MLEYKNRKQGRVALLSEKEHNGYEMNKIRMLAEEASP